MMDTTLDPYIHKVVGELHQLLQPITPLIVSYGSIHQTHYQPSTSNINLLITLPETIDLADTREKLAKWWPQHKDIIRQPPRTGHHSMVQTHLKLHPLFLQHLHHHGRFYPLQHPFQSLESSIQMPAHTYLTLQAFQASTEVTDFQAQAILPKLIRQIVRTSEPDNNTTIRQVGMIWQTIASQYPSPTLITPPKTSAPYPIHNLIALYAKLDTLIAVVPSAIDLYLSDWPFIWTQIKEQDYTALHLTTPAQFQLILEQYGALDVRLLSYDHVWGRDLIKSLKEPSIVDICFAAARYASDIQVNYFSDHYFYDPASSEHGEHHIHDLQNKLLNIRLQNEILSRLKLIAPHEPPMPLPGRDTPHKERFKAIYQHLTWWINHYLSEANKNR